MQAQQYAEEAAKLGSFPQLLKLHWDAAAQQFRDWGNHTQDVALHWQVRAIPYHQSVLPEFDGRSTAHRNRCCLPAPVSAA